MTIQEELAQKQTELRSKIVEARKAVADKSDNADSLMTEVRDYESDIKKLKELVDAMPDTLDEEDKGDDKDAGKSDDSQPTPPANPADDQQRSHTKEKEVRDVPQPVGATPKKEYRDLLNEFLHSRGEKRDGITSTDAGAVIPKEIIYNPEAAIATVTDLSSLVTKTAVTTSKGNYPILKRASTKLATVAELAKNPELGKPEFTNVEWSVDTYRGYIPV
ncbi:phage major capsid protein, partial [Leuconostoc lactis]|uniref:phage major capsid protein n=1 Tax=Leuconostoc lactis TaxID=1246 RepID=UPI0021A56870